MARIIWLFFLLSPVWAVGQTVEELISYIDNAETYTFSEHNEFPRDIINQITTDQYGYVWIATSGSGVYRFDGYNLKNYSPVIGKKGSYPGKDCLRIVLLEDQSIWFVYKGGLCTFDYTTEQFIGKIDNLEGFNDFEVNVLNLFDLDEGHLLVCTKVGFWILDKNKFSIVKRFLQTDKPVPDNTIGAAIRIPGEDKIYLSSLKGFYIFDPDTGEIEMIPFNNADIGKQLQGNYFNPIIYQDSAIYTLGDNNTYLIKYDLSTGDLTRSKGKTNDRFGYPWKERISELKSINDSTILFNWQETFATYNTKAEKITELNHEEFEGLGPFHFDHSGTLWFYTNWRLNKLTTPLHSFARPLKAEIALADIEINGKNEIRSRYVKDLSLKEYEKNLRFNIALLNPADTNTIDFQYQLEGDSKRWIDIPSHYISLNDLSGGTYAVNVRAWKEGKIIAEKKLLNFSKEKTIYEQWWFWLLTILTTAVLIYLFNRFRIQAALKEERLKAGYETKMAELQMQALQSQMNPHFIFNALNSIKHFILTNEKFKASEYLSSFSSLVRQVLNNSKSAKINLENEIETLRLYIEMEKMRFNQQFNYSIYVDPELDSLDVEFPPMIFQPYIENAIWHGLMHKKEPGLLNVKFEKQNGHLYCSIEDNGIGREKAMEVKSKNATHQKSLGMQITKERMDFSQLNAKVKIIDLKARNGDGTGTRVEIRIPLIP